MNDTHRLPSLSPAAARRIDRICDSFEGAWKAGQRPRLEDYLDPAEGPLRSALLRQLLLLEWEYRLGVGEQPQAAEYEARFPGDVVLVEAVCREVGGPEGWTPLTTTSPTGADSIPTNLGEYRILRRLGRGGMGVVYEAVQESLGRAVALKVLLGSSLLDPTQRERFRREAQLTAQLQHPNIVQLFEVGEHEGQPFLALEFVRGPTLADHLAGAPQPPLDAATLVETLAGAVQHAHQHGVIHRDLKPANILLSRDEERGARDEIQGKDTSRADSSLAPRPSPLVPVPKIADFGLAHPVDGRDLTATGAIVGTPSYMAPEQARGKSKAQPVGPACDIYALGAILYACLTGRPPFQAPTALDTVLLVIAEEPVPPTRLQPTVPRDLETICLKCLHKEPARRYASAADLAADLRRFLAGEPILARPAGRLERVGKWARRRPAVAALLAVSSLATSALLGGGAYFAANLAAQVERAEGAEKQAKDRAEEAEAEKHKVQAERDKALFQALRAENARHALQISLALSAWERDDVTESERILGKIEAPFQRTWETRHLHSLCRRKALPLVTLRHQGRVTSVAISSDGRRIASGSYDQTVKVWDAQTGQEALSLKGHTCGLSSVAFSADGKRIVSGGGDLVEFPKPGEVKVWDATTGQELHSLKGHMVMVTCVAFSSDGKRIASGSGNPLDLSNPGEVRVWDAATGQELHSLKGHLSGVASVAFSTDGKRIVSGSLDSTAKVWDAENGKEVLTLKGHTERVGCVAFSANGKRIASGGTDQTVKVWDAQTGQEALSFKGHTKEVTSVAFSADGKRIASSSADQTVKVWDAATGQELRTLQGHTGFVTSVAFSKGHSDRIFSVAGTTPGWESEAQTVRGWDVAVGQEKLTLKGFANPVFSVALSADGKHIAVAGSGLRSPVTMYEAATGRPKRGFQGHRYPVTTVTFSADGTRIVTGSEDQTVRVWDAVTGQELHSLMGHTVGVTSVAFSADGRRIVSAGGTATVGDPRTTGVKVEVMDKGEVKVWDADTGQEIYTLKGHTGGVASVAFSPDGKHIVSGSADQTVKIWDAATGQELHSLRGHSARVTGVAFSADGKRIISGSMDQTVQVWDASTGQTKLTLRGDTGGVMSVAFSADGHRIASGGADQTVKVWDAATGQEKLTLKGHSKAVTGVVFSADGQRIVSVSQDDTVKVWEAPAIDASR